VRVLEGAVLAFHVRVDEPELFAVVRQAGRPDAAAVGVPAHVELRGPRERAAEQRPIGQIRRVVDLHSRIPLKRAGRDVVVGPDPEDGWVRVEARQDWVADQRHFQRRRNDAMFGEQLRCADVLSMRLLSAG
jgi:hypothetical protein